MTTDMLVMAGPVFDIDGAVSRDLARDVAWLEVAEDASGLRTLVASFHAVDPFGETEEGMLLHLDGSSIGFGREIEVALGPEDDQHLVFAGVISAISADLAEGATPLVSVCAEDRFEALRMTRRSKTFTEVSDGDIVRQIADEHGLSTFIDADGPTYDLVQQLNQSDLAFLRQRAERLGADVWVDGSELGFATRDRRTGPDITLVNGNELVAARLDADLAHQRTAIRVSGYDAVERAVIEREADSSTIDAEAGDGTTGPSMLQQAIGDRPSHRVRDVPLTGDDADAWARAEMLMRSRRFVTVDGETSGTPSLTVGATLTLERVGQIFEGPGYYVTEVRHTFDLDRGHRTCFRAERPTITEGS